MNTEQALQILTQATALLSATREQHAQIMHALQVIQEALKPKP